MSKREYKPPGYDQLNKDQDAVLALGEDGQYLVVGGPGTGKSVVALLRARKFQSNHNYLFLTFNHVLNSATKQMSGSDLECDTAVSWFYGLQYNLAPGVDYESKKMPETKDYKPDYEEVISRFETLVDNEPDKMPPTDTHLIIDEGQDLPIGFYESLQTLGYKDFFIVADQNQQITEDNSDRRELTDVLALDAEDVLELKENYRNSSPIAMFAQLFYTDKSSPKPDIPVRPTLDTPTLYIYQRVDSCVEMILREADRDPSKLIGLIVATETKRDSYVKSLTRIDIERENEKPVVSSYSSEMKQNVNIDYSMGGIVVLSDKSVKGIEFDVVYIVLDDLKIVNNDTDAIKKRLYVMASRAKEKLFLFRSASRSNEVEALLPTDEALMLRDTI